VLVGYKNLSLNVSRVIHVAQIERQKYNKVSADKNMSQTLFFARICEINIQNKYDKRVTWRNAAKLTQ